MELLERDLSFEDMLGTLAGYSFDRLRPEIVARVQLKTSIIPPGVPRLLTEQKIRSKGEVWVVHQNDADDFPSDPHAENYEAGVKLHLGNGALYKKRKCVGAISKKDLLAVRSKISRIQLPALTV
jgi:hypothetical protein